MPQESSVQVQRSLSHGISSDEILHSLETMTWAVALPTYDLVHVGAAVEHLSGYTATDLLSHRRRWRSLIHPADLAAVQQWLADLKLGDRSTLQCRLLRADGQVQSVICRATLVCDAQMNPVRLQGTVMAIAPAQPQKRQQDAEAIAPARHDSSETFQAIFEQASVGIAQIDSQGRYQLVNQCFCKMVGYTAAELLSKSFGDLTHPDDLPSDLACHQQLMSGLVDSFTQEKRQICKDGRVRWVKLSVSAVRYRHDRSLSALPQGSIAIIWDIGDRKQMEQSLRQSQDMLRLVIDNIPQQIFWKDTGLVYLGCNQRQAERAGLRSPAEIVGKTDFDLPWTLEEAHYYQACDRRVIETNRPEYRIPETQHQANGQLLLLEANKIPLHDLEGNVIGILGTVDDVTEQKRAEAALKQANADMQAIFAAFPDLFFRISADGTYLDCKAPASHNLMFPSEQLIGQRVQDVLPHPVGKGMWQGIQVTVRTHSLTVLEHALDLPQGRQYFEVRIVPYQPQEVLVLVRNQTQRKQAERALVESEKRFQRLSENLPGVIYQYLQHSSPEDGQFLYVSPSLIRLYELDPQQLTDTYRLQDIIDPTDWPQVQNSMRQAAAALSPWQAEWRIKTALQSQQKWVQGIACPERQPDGSILWDGILLDITERKRFETMLQAQAHREQALNQVIQAIRDSLDLRTIFSTAASQTATLLDAARVCIIRYAPSQESWQFVMDHQLHHKQSNWVGVELQDSDRHLFARLKQGASLRLTAQQLCRILSSDCAEIVAEAAGHWLIVPLMVSGELTSEGLSRSWIVPMPEPPYVWGCLCLVSSHPHNRWQDSDYNLAQVVANQLAIAIQQSELYHRIRLFNLELEHQVQHRTIELQHALAIEEMLKRIIDNVRDSLNEDEILQTVVRELTETLVLDCCNTGLYDLSRRVVHVRQECITIDITPFQGYVEPLSSRPQIYQQLLAGKTLYFTQVQPDAMRPGYRPTVLCCPIMSEGQVVGDLWLYRPQFAVFSDIEIRLVEQIVSQCAIAMRQARLYQAAQAQVQELKRLSHLKDDFLCTVSHELRTPVANIHMATQMLERYLFQGDRPSEPVAQYLKLLHDGAQQEMDLINDLLDLQHLNAGTRPLEVSEIQVQTWLPHLIEAFELRAHARNQTLKLELSSVLPSIYSDQRGLQRILIELLNNACKYTPPGEVIALRVGISKAMIWFEVHNTGVEIPAEELPRIFDKFYRIPQSDRWQHGGTGLGLALARELARYLQGEIDVESDRHGTRFRLTLPTYHNTLKSCPLDL